MKKSGYAKKALAWMCSTVLVVSMFPSSVFALDGQGDSASEDASQTSASLVAEIDQVEEAMQVFEAAELEEAAESEKTAESEEAADLEETIQPEETVQTLGTAQVEETPQLATAEAHIHDGITFDKALDASMSSGGTLDSGNYYLTEDIALESFCSIQIPSGKVVNICLNGHVIKPSRSTYGILITGSLALYDCSLSHGGAIIGDFSDFECIFVVGGSFTMNSGSIKNNRADTGGGVSVNAGIFTMNGGSITGCSSRYGGGVFVKDGIFTMNGGSITGCSSLYGGGVYVESGSCALGGAAQITGNQNSDTKEASNVYLLSGSTISLGTGTGAPVQGMSVGVTLKNGKGAFTGENAADYSQYFTSDNSSYAVSCGEGNVLSLMDPAPTASDFEFFTPDNLIYDGQAKVAQFSSGKQGIGDLTIKYYDSEGNLLSGAPVNAGTYMVKLDVSEGTTCAGVKGLSDESWTFTVMPKSLTTCTITKFNLAYIETGKDITPAVAVKEGDEVLELGADYSIAYSDNKAAGTATITATGMGNYAGTLETTFKIVTLEECSTSGLSAYTVGKAVGDASVLIGEGTVLNPDCLKSVSVDGKTLDATAYTVKQGSIEIVVGEDYLNTLAAGKHTFIAELGGEYDGMAYEAEFTVNAAESTSKYIATPKTGDENNLMGWMVLMSVSLIGLAVGLFAGKGTDLR